MPRSLLPIDALAGSSLRAPWSWQAVTIGRALEAAAPAMARDGRAVLLADSGPEGLAAAVLGGASAGYRLVSARLADGDDEVGGSVEFLPPGAARPPAPRTRSNVSLPPVPGGAGDPDLVPGPGLFSAPERFDQRPFSAAEAARTVTDTAVETLRARGEPARYERLFGEVLVGLDRAGQLRRLATRGPRTWPGSGTPVRAIGHPGCDPRPTTGRPTVRSAVPGATATPHGPAAVPIERSGRRRISARGSDAAWPPAGEASPDPVDRLLALVRDEMTRPGNGRLVEIEPGRWWLADPKDQEAAAIPLADRVEWAVFSLLSTAGPLSEAAFFERIATLFTGHDLPDEGLVRACLESYRSMASTPDRLVTSDDLLQRSQEHTDLLATLADAGHRLGLRVWLARREQTRRTHGKLLGDRLGQREKQAYLGGISRPAEDLADVDCIWYVRSKVALLFEVEWTAMLGEPLLRRHVRIPPDDSLVRFLVIAPERTELVRYKMVARRCCGPPSRRAASTSSSPTTCAGSSTSRSRTWPTWSPTSGLDPMIERSGEQMPLFGG